MAKQGDLGAGLVELELAVERMPQSSVAHNSLGIVRQLIGDREGALVSYREAVRLDDANAPAHLNLAALLAALGQTREAELHRLRARELGFP